ncbi:MAG: hypothetical protein ACRD2G_03455 [Terriglobia bacterium]
MNPAEVKPGQVWRSNEDGCEWLVTRKYSDGLDSYAVLRKQGGAEADLQRIRLEPCLGGFSLPGFVLVAA